MLVMISFLQRERGEYACMGPGSVSPDTWNLELLFATCSGCQGWGSEEQATSRYCGRSGGGELGVVAFQA